jgi:hypothetical protein
LAQFDAINFVTLHFRKIKNLLRWVVEPVLKCLQIIILRWLNGLTIKLSILVLFYSNFIPLGIPIKVKRFDRKEKCSVIIECPEIINLYSKNMGDVDKHD